MGLFDTWVGEGVLRDGIHDIFRLKKEVKSFVNQYHPHFGYGRRRYFSSIDR